VGKCCERVAGVRRGRAFDVVFGLTGSVVGMDISAGVEMLGRDGGVSFVSGAGRFG